tara:strand:- start:510 stop:809 length:300 start_codon:yes stop_codon:yes gene_type:complete
MTDRAELKEKVVAAIRDAWNNASNDGNPISYYLADAAIAVARPSIRAEALEEAAKLAEAMADEWSTVWRNRMKADSHMEGKSDGADEIAAAIRAMIKES